MTLLQAIFLGIVQGLTEFLPISSTAHLLIAQLWMGLESSPALFAFTVLVQLGTLLAVILYFWKDLWAIAGAFVAGLLERKPFAAPQSRLGWYLILATIPAVIAGFFLKDLVEALFARPALETVIRLGLTIVLLLAAERFGARRRGMEGLTWQDALWVGLFQVLSVFPGASRSGTTISGGMLRGLDRPAAARFAFLISIPVMLSAGAYQAIELIGMEGFSEMLPPILAGMVSAALVGYAAIHWLLKFLARRPLTLFALYCAILGIIVLVTLWG